jgi:hypothetical protein
MKKVIGFIFGMSILTLVYLYRNEITTYVIDNYIYKKEIVVPNSNEYKRNYDFILVQNTDNFFPNNKQELYNVFYTILNNGYENFTFYCGKEYDDCVKDVTSLTDKNNQILSGINNMVHPFNSYNTININMNNLGRINVTIDKLYNQNDINLINNEVDKIFKEIINDNMTIYQKIKAAHDYIINTTEYDKTWVNSTNKAGKSNTAYGALFNHKALCGGYTDLMALFLDKLGIKNYKIASDNHIWNYVFVNNTWRHIDLTWDDPVTNTGKNILQYEYYILDTKTLESKGDNEHTYNKELYIEAQ